MTPTDAVRQGPFPTTIPIEEYRNRAQAWLAQRLQPVSRADKVGVDAQWGEGSDDVSVFHRLLFEDEAELLRKVSEWHQARCDAGFGAITWPVELGGAGLSHAHHRAYEEVEAGYVTPDSHETFSVTTGLVAPTINIFGTEEQRSRFVRRFLRAEELCCQLFSEPGAGSDLAGLGTSAVRDGDDWVVNGQKVWTSGAQFSQWGELLARTDPGAPKHAGLTAFMVAMDMPGVEVRPIKQMSGGSSFNEVFFSDARIPDNLRLGDVGSGWKVGLTTLGFERGGSGSGRSVGGSWEQLLGLAQRLGRTDDPWVRQRLMEVYSGERVREYVRMWAASRAAAGHAPGPEGSIGKLAWTIGLTRIGEVAAELLGARLTADTGDWGTYAWNDHILGAPGYRIAGGSDEIQRNIIAERVLGLPAEIRVDRGMPWSAIPR